MAPENVVVFAVASIALLLIPGPAVTYIVTRSIDQGRRAGLVSVLGVHVGTSVHVVAATVGLSGIVLASSLAFGVVRYAGAAYLIYLGVRAIFARSDDAALQIAPARRMRRVFTDAIVVNVLNPKVALFFLAFLPQFVVPSAGSIPLQILLLGAIFTGLGLITDSAYALFASGAASWLRRSSAFRRLRTRVAGVIYVVLGASAAITGTRAEG